MKDYKKYFKKAGGMNLLRQYWQAGVLHLAVIEFLLVGKSKVGLQILRLFVSMKVNQRLKRRYAAYINNLGIEDLPKESSRKVWVCWWQGMETAPALVQKCYKSIEKYLGQEWEIILITEKNYCNYVSFPDFILHMFENKQISLTHFSDLLRLELLINHGGMWIDSTVLCTSGNIPKSILNADLFVYQTQKPGADGRATVMSNWLIYSKTNSKILMMTRMLLYEYWRREKKLLDYIVFHQFFTIACQYYLEEAKRIPPFCNSVPHILLLHLFDSFDDTYWNDLKSMTCFHKLSYKLSSIDIEKKGTFYDKIISNADSL